MQMASIKEARRQFWLGVEAEATTLNLKHIQVHAASAAFIFIHRPSAEFGEWGGLDARPDEPNELCGSSHVPRYNDRLS